MISREDIDAFAEDNGAALAQAGKYARRAQRGLPVDRWATAYEAQLVARGIRAQAALILMLAETLEALADGNTTSDG